MEFTTYESVLIYSIIVLFTVLFVYKADSENSKLYLVLAYIIMAVPSAFRYGVGIDYEPYLNLYEQIISYGSVDASLKMHIVERSFMYLSFISNSLLGNGLLVFATYSFLTQFFMLSGIWYFRKNISPTFVVFIYMCGYYWRTYNIFRQALAVSIIFFAYRYIREKKIIKYIICVIIAGFFHTTAYIAIIVYVYYNLKFPKSLRFLNYLFPIVCFFSLDKIMNLVYSFQMFSNYANYYQKVNLSPFTIGTLIELGILFIFLIAKDRKRDMLLEEDDDFYRKIMIIDFTFTIILYYLFFAARIGLYFTIGKCLALGSIHRKGDKVTIREADRFDMAIIVYYIFVFVRCMIQNSYGQLPYSIW